MNEHQEINPTPTQSVRNKITSSSVKKEPFSLKKPESNEQEPRHNIRKWLKILGRICQEKPRVVLRALSQPQVLSRFEVTEESIRADNLSWDLGGRKRAKEQFTALNLDSQKMLSLIEFFRQKTHGKRYFMQEGELQSIEATYQYRPENVTDLMVIANLSDQPTVLLDKLGKVIDYDNFNSFNLRELTNYALAIMENPEALSLLDSINNFDDFAQRLNLNCLKNVKDEAGNIKVVFGNRDKHLEEPIQYLTSLSEHDRNRLLSEDNLLRFQAFWPKLSSTEKPQLELLPHLLKVTLDPELNKALDDITDQTASYQQGYFYDDYLNQEAYKLVELIERLEALHQQVPELWSLLEANFAVTPYLEGSLSTSYYQDNLRDISKVLESQSLFRRLTYDQHLINRAKLLKQYDLKLSVRDQYPPLIQSQSITDLEKTLVIYKLAGGYFNFSRSYSYLDQLSEIWEQISNEGLKNFSIEDLTMAFSQLGEARQDAKHKIHFTRLISGVDTPTDLNKRLNIILDPEICSMIDDTSFIEGLFKNDFNVFWSGLFDNLQEYKILYRRKDELFQKLDLLSSINNYNVEDLYLILDMSDGELQSINQECSQNRAVLNKDSLSKFGILSSLSDSERQTILAEFQPYLSQPLDNFYDTRLSAESLRLYLGLSVEQRQEVWQLLPKLNDKYNLDIGTYLWNEQSLKYLSFLCKIRIQPSLAGGFDRYTAELVKQLLEQNQDIFQKDIPLSLLVPNMMAFADVVDSQLTKENFQIEDYVNENGQVSAKFLGDLLNNNRHPFNHYDFSIFLTDNLLNQMDVEDRVFWTLWQKYVGKDELLIFLVNHRHNFSELFTDGQLNTQFFQLLAMEKPTLFLDDLRNEWQHLSQSELKTVLPSLLEGLDNKDLLEVRFEDIYQLFSQQLAVEGQLDPYTLQFANQNLEINLSSQLIAMLDKFHLQAEENIYDALIPDRKKYWQANSSTLVKLLQLPWSIDSFDRLRSLIQNVNTKQILTNVENGLLYQLSDTIGLNLDNIYYLNINSINWLSKNGLNSTSHLNFFRTILNEKPSSFNSCVTALRALESKEDQDRLISEPLYRERLLKAIEEFKNVTPSLVKLYILEDDEKVRELYKQKLKEFQSTVHLNQPIMSLAEGEGGLDFLADMICATFPGNDAASVKQTLANLKDQCADLDTLSLREQGYQGQVVSREKIAQLRNPNQTIDQAVVKLIETIFIDPANAGYLNEGGEAKYALEGWSRLLVEAGATNQKALFNEQLPEVVACARVALGDKIDFFLQHVSGDLSQLAGQNELLSKAKELFGIYYKDNAAETIAQFLEQHPADTERLLKILSSKKLAALEKNIANSKSLDEESRLLFKQVLADLDSENSSLPDRQKNLAWLLAFMVDRSMFSNSSGLRRQVNKDLKKIVLRDKEGQEIDPSLVITGHVSKNAASFFAKTTANVCTAGDLSLYRRPDHFHVNLVDRDQVVVGNIQAYLTEYDGQPALIFRGFNPSTSIVSSTNAAIICDQMVDMVKQIAQDNQISQVLIPEQDGWHPLTNRVGEGVADYFADRFYQPENKVNFSFAITDSKTVNTFYRINLP